MPSAAALALAQVTCTFVSQGRAGPALHRGARRHASTVGAGEFVSVVGPTGCGKSTLLNVAAGLLRAEQRHGRACSASRSTGINRRAGYMFQTDSLMPWRTALRQRDGRARVPRRRRPTRSAQAPRWLKRVGLGGFGDRYPHQLSGGMRKRVGLAQTLVLDPDIILMDEPFSALDIQTRQLMENEVLALWAAKKKAVLFITHDLDEAIAMSDRVVVLSAGPGVASDRRVRDRPAAAARRRRGARDAALRRAAPGDLGRAARGGAEGLPAAAGGMTSACGSASSRTEDTCASGRSGCWSPSSSLWHAADDAGPVPAVHVRQRPPGGVLLRRAAEDLRPHLALVRRQRRHLPAPLGHADRDGARVRASARCSGSRSACGWRCSPMAAAIARPLHQGAEQHAARHPGADLRGLVRPRHRRARSRSA